jgi:hypothetical protein
MHDHLNVKYITPSVELIVTILFAEKMSGNYNSTFKSEHSEPIIICDVLSLVRPTSFSFNLTFSNVNNFYGPPVG